MPENNRKKEKAELIEQLGYDPDRDPMQDYWDSESAKICYCTRRIRTRNIIKKRGFPPFYPKQQGNLLIMTIIN